MSVTCTFKSQADVVETLETNVPAMTSGSSISHTGYKTEKSLSATGTVSQPAITKCAIFSKALSGGSATIDCTALTGTNGATVDFTGLKICVMKFKNPSANANAITVAKGASNGLGVTTSGTTFSIPIAPGAEWMHYCNEGMPDVGSGAKTFDLTGTGSQALEVTLLAG